MYTDSLAKAIQTADTDKVRDFLQRGGDPNTKSKRKNTLLHESAHHLVPDIVALLLQAGADPDAEEPAFQKRPLHTAIGPKQFPQVIYARPPEPADVIARRHRVVDLLLQAGADPGRRKQPGEMNAYFRSPLQFAARQGDPAAGARQGAIAPFMI